MATKRKSLAGMTPDQQLAEARRYVKMFDRNIAGLPILAEGMSPERFRRKFSGVDADDLWTRYVEDEARREKERNAYAESELATRLAGGPVNGRDLTWRMRTIADAWWQSGRIARTRLPAELREYPKQRGHLYLLLDPTDTAA